MFSSGQNQMIKCTRHPGSISASLFACPSNRAFALEIAFPFQSFQFCVQSRSSSFGISGLSALSVKLTRRLTGADQATAQTNASHDISPRSRSPVAQAAREAAARQSKITFEPPSPFGLDEAASRTTRHEALSDVADDVACLGPTHMHNFLVDVGGLMKDTMQETALVEFESLFCSFERAQATLSSKPSPGRSLGLYIHGNVGTGKTMLMDLFFKSIKARYSHLRVHRTHLHEFMHGVHAELNRYRMLNGCADVAQQSSTYKEPESLLGSGIDGRSGFFYELPSRWWLLGEEDNRGRRRTGLAAACMHTLRYGGATTTVQRLGYAIAKELDVLCFDEVAISTIQDCVVLGPLLDVLCRSGVLLVATSNRAPEDLYTGGLNRHVHLPRLINAIREHCRVHRLTSDVDHRKRMSSEQHEVRPATFLWQVQDDSPDAMLFLDMWWKKAARLSTMSSKEVALSYGRSTVALQSSCRSCVRFNFSDLCRFSSDDFAALCSQFRTMLISSVPRLRGENHSDAQRWIWLVDHCYEHHTQLIFTSQAGGPEDLIDLQAVAMVGAGTGQSLQELAFAVSRTISRMHEMQTFAFRTKTVLPQSN